jgi:predicted lipid-binding transport protein (Tim44 family)
MMGAGGFPVDLILFGMVAAFLVLRLRSILGRRSGFERPPELRPQEFNRGPFGAAQVIEGKAEPVSDAPTAAAARTLPDPSSPVGQTLARMQALDGNFDPARFLDGAQAAFRMVVTAFASGNRTALQPLLSEDTWRAFDLAIAAREQAGESQRTEIKAITAATIEDAELRGRVADITVRFVSDQVNVTIGRDGQPAAGTEALTEIVDVWTFERELASADPTWRLVAARSA